MDSEISSPTVMIASGDAYELATLGASLRLNGISIVAEAQSAAIADNLYRYLVPKVILIDLQFSNSLLLALIMKFRKINPELGVVLITACPDLRLLGISEKEIPHGSQIVLKKSFTDLSLIGLAIAQSLLSAESGEKKVWVNSHGSLLENSFKSILDDFTDIQIQTFMLLGQGFTNFEIARVRFVSEKSVEQIVSRIAEHFQLENDKTHNQRVLIAGEYFKWTGTSTTY